jgi:hypothetical protein
MATAKKKIRKIKPYTARWEKLANELARERAIIHPARRKNFKNIK